MAITPAVSLLIIIYAVSAVSKMNGRSECFTVKALYKSINVSK